MTKADVIVVGAGITGLSAANALVQAGRTVSVLEAAEQPGGRMKRLSHRNDTCDAGPQVIHSSYREFHKLLDQVGLRRELRQFKYRVEYLDHRGGRRTSQGQAQTARLMGLRGAFDLGQFYLRYFKLAKKYSEFETALDIPDYDNVNALEATQWAGQRFRDYILRPFLYAMTNSRPEYISLYHMIGALRLRMTTEGFGLPCGVRGVAEALAERLPVTYGTPVRSLIYDHGVVQGVTLESGRSMAAKHVIVASEIGWGAKLVPAEWVEARRYLENFPHTPMPLVFFFLDRPTPSQSLSWVGHPFRDVPYNMAVDHSKRAPWQVPSGRGIISCWPGHPLSQIIIEKPDAEIIAMALGDLDGFIPGVANFVDKAYVVRHRWGVGRLEPGIHRKTLDFKRFIETQNGISFAANDPEGVSMEAGIRSGLRAAERALRAVE